MKTAKLVTQCVDSGTAPPHPALAGTVAQQCAVSALLRRAYAAAAPEPPQLAFLAQRVIARAHAQPRPPLVRAWHTLRAFFGFHPFWAWSGAAAFALAIAVLPVWRFTHPAPPPVHSFVIYQLPGGSGFIRMIEYHQSSDSETSHDHS